MKVQPRLQPADFASSSEEAARPAAVRPFLPIFSQPEIGLPGAQLVVNLNPVRTLIAGSGVGSKVFS